MSNPKTTKTKGESSILPQIEQLLSEQTSVILHAVDEKLTAQDKRLEEKFVAQEIYLPNQPIIEFQASLSITERDDIAVLGRLTLPFPMPSIVESFREYADIVSLERFHALDFRAAVDIEQGSSAVSLSLLVSSRAARS